MDKVELIRREAERRLITADYKVNVKAELQDIVAFIDSLQDEPKRGYDPEYLQSCIDKATKSWEGVDVDKFMAEVRGYEDDDSKVVKNDHFEKELEEAAEDGWALYEYREHPRGLYSTCYIDGFKAGANWQKEQDESRRKANIELANSDAPVDEEFEIAFNDIWGDVEKETESLREMEPALKAKLKGSAHDWFESGKIWQKEQDNYDTIFWKGMQYAKKQMMEEAVEGFITNSTGAFDYDVAAFSFDSEHRYTVLLRHMAGRKYGDKVKLIIIKEDERVDNNKSLEY